MKHKETLKKDVPTFKPENHLSLSDEVFAVLEKYNVNEEVIHGRIKSLNI
ncbi:MAG: hypothetical protein LBH96_01930 [Candidatus Peribacteria bacterium]|jgi:hypothetical protein|nr:hypothetical protein [Candidatus Peribacteria bacterium]